MLDRLSTSGCAAIAIMVLGLVWSGCGVVEERREADRQAIETTLHSYVEKLADAYKSMSAAQMRPEAAEKQVAVVHGRIGELGRQGRHLRPELRSMTIESMETWHGSNAAASTHEVWDLRIYALGSDNLINEELGSVNRVSYQLRKNDGQWQVVDREIHRK